jgi:predicted AlkP superfamily pyrophosphatase or phosphodiesterase
MYARLVIALCLIWVPLAGRAEPAPIVIVLSWDGMRHDYPDRGEFPALERLATEGVRARRLTAVFPSSTFPGHVSMATGTYPDRHGIVDNVFIDEEKGRYSYSSDANWIEVEPLWIAAERQGVTTATYFWVGSETDWHGQGTTYRIAPFDASRPESVKVDQMLEWLALPEADRPRLIMSYWAGADHVGHDDGPNSDSLVTQIHDQDAQLGRLLGGIDAMDLWPRTTLILVSDHGMTAVDHFLDLGAGLADRGIDAVVLGAAVGEVYLKTPVPDPTMREALSDFFADVPGVTIYKKEELPADLRLKRKTRLGDWVVVLSPPYALRSLSTTERVLQPIVRLFGREWGMHGYDPALPDMGGIFYAVGRGVPDGLTLDDVRQVDLAATVAALLHIEPPMGSEGAPIWPVPD